MRKAFANKEWGMSDAGEAILYLEISACCERISRLLLNWFPDEFKYQASREISMGRICWLVGPKAIAVFKWNAIQRRKRCASLYIHQHVNVRRKAWKSAWVNGAGRKALHTSICCYLILVCLSDSLSDSKEAVFYRAFDFHLRSYLWFYDCICDGRKWSSATKEIT